MSISPVVRLMSVRHAALDGASHDGDQEMYVDSVR